MTWRTARLSHPDPYDPVVFWQAAGAGYYDMFDASGYTAQEAIMVEMLGRHQPGSCLDLGCGFGRLGMMLRRVLPACSYTGVDVSSDQLDKAAEFLPGARLFRAAVLRFLSGVAIGGALTWDAVICADFLMHQPPGDAAEIVGLSTQVARKLVLVSEWWNPGETGSSWCWQHDYTTFFRSAGWDTEQVLVPEARQAVWLATPA